MSSNDPGPAKIIMGLIGGVMFIVGILISITTGVGTIFGAPMAIVGGLLIKEAGADHW